MDEELNELEQEQPLPKDLAAGALCGSFTCGGCYEVADGVTFHSPRPGYDQTRLATKDE